MLYREISTSTRPVTWSCKPGKHNILNCWDAVLYQHYNVLYTSSTAYFIAFIVKTWNFLMPKWIKVCKNIPLWECSMFCISMNYLLYTVTSTCSISYFCRYCIGSIITAEGRLLPVLHPEGASGGFHADWSYHSKFIRRWVK